MGDILFVIRMLVMTLIVVVVMQIKIGETTIEAQAQAWLRRSPAVGTLREVAHGGVKALSVGYKMIVNLIDTQVSSRFSREQMAGARSITLGLERSDSYSREKAEKEKRAQDADSEDAAADPVR